MRDIAVLASLLVALPLLLRSPFAAFSAWAWANLAAITFYVYGFMTAVPIVQLLAFVALLSLAKAKPGEIGKFSPTMVPVLLMLFGIHTVLVATFAYSGLSRNWEIATNILKNLLLCLLMPMVVVGRARIVAFTLCVALGMASHGIVDALKFLASAGSHKAIGNAKLGDNNHLALSVAMVLPLTLFFWQHAKANIARHGALAASLLIGLAVVSTQSRAGLIGLVCILLGYFGTSPRKIFRGVFLILILGAAVYAIAPPTWFERMSTIQTAGDDASFMGRVTQWKRASAIALENPLLGGGFQSVQSPALFVEFRDDPGLLGFIESPPPDKARAAHSVYFELMGDTGFTGLAIFLLLMATAFFMARSIRKMVRLHGRADLEWTVTLSRGIGASIFALLVSGATLSISYYELHFILVSLQAVISHHVAQACAADATIPARTGPARSRPPRPQHRPS